MKQCFYLVILVFLFSPHLFSDILECKGNVDLWFQKKSGWQKSNLKKTGYLELSSAEVAAVRIGTYLKFPSVTVYPFLGINAEVKSKSVKFTTDNESFFEVLSADKKLRCTVKSEAAP